MSTTRQWFSSVQQHVLRSMPRSEELELLDGGGREPAELAENFRDIRRVNSLLGGTATILRLLPDLLAITPLDRPVTMLDLGSGCADIPLAIARWAEHRGIPVDIVASDAADDVLALAQEEIGSRGDISLARYDARAVPLPDDSFDIVLCSMTLHHFPPDDAMQILREMDRLARSGFILNDLRRSRLGYVAAWVAARITTRNRLTRNDAPLSVRRAYTPRELSDLLQDAGIEHATVITRPWFRMAALKRGAHQHA
jgi:ubiquinone/menaquinone biosynthesis C-methylase UbiE